VADAHGEYIGGDGALNFIEGYDGTPDGAINFDGAIGQGYMIYLGTWSAIKEGPDTSMTLAFWVKWYGSYADNTQDIINKRDNYEPPDMVWGVNKPGPGTSDSIAVKRRGMSARSFTSMDVDEWTHIAVALDGVNAYFYKNGEFQEELPYVYGTGYEARIHVGTAGNSDGSWRQVDAFNGALDEVRFYSMALEDDEIKIIYEGVSGLEDDQLFSGNVASILAQNYPNPFKGSTSIKYTLNQGAQTELVVYDIVGNKVATLVNDYRSMGTYKVEWDASELSTGVYVYQLKTGDVIHTKKMKLIR
jgi:hypothetical protein